MKNLAKNLNVLNQLPVASFNGYQYAYLIEEEDINTFSTSKNTDEKVKASQYRQSSGFPVYEFLYNPESIRQSLNIEYTETAIPFTSVQPVNFHHGGNQVWTIPDLWIDGLYNSRNIQPQIDALIALRNPDRSEQLRVRPKILYFKWGQYQFGSCVLTNIDITITNWISYPVRAKCSLTFKEVPPNSNKLPSTVSLIKNPNNLPNTLTDKQVIDGTKVVSSYALNPTNLGLLPTSVQRVLKSNNPKLQINKESGAVTVLDSQGNSLLTIGTYNGHTFIPGKNSFSITNPLSQILKNIF